MKFASVDPQLFHLILNMCVEPGKMCIHEMAAIDAKGGLGLAGIDNVQSIAYDKYNRRGGVVASTKIYVASVCTKAAPMGIEVSSAQATPVNAAPLVGHGLPLPGSSFQSFAPRPSNS